jgi:hypothetical protein
MNNRTLLPEQAQKAAACQAQSESFFLHKRPPPRPEAWGKKTRRLKISLLFTDGSLLLSLVRCCTFPLWEYVHFLFFHRFERAKRKRQKWKNVRGAGVVVFEADFLLKFVRLVFFHSQP